MKDTLVYISGPYSSDPDGNTRKVLAVADQIARLGYIPGVPHFSHWWHERYPHDYEFWMRQGAALLRRCDVNFRALPGKSPGADREKRQSIQNGQPVVYSVEELQEQFPP
jgi:hypothetical protein